MHQPQVSITVVVVYVCLCLHNIKCGNNMNVSAGMDYNNTVIENQLVFDENTSLQCITIRTILDEIVEYNKTFSLNLTTDDRAVVFIQPDTTITIVESKWSRYLHLLVLISSSIQCYSC